jgi:isopentenyl-diphosphate delta-isomerase
MSELIDVYDRDRRPTGRAVPRETDLADGEYRLVIHVFIFDSAGRLLIQLRSPKKQLYGGKWDVSAGGHSRAGENSAAAARRELMEELGIDFDFSSVDPVMTANFHHGFDDYYVIDRDLDPDKLRLQESEVVRVKWVTPDEIYAMIDSGEFLPFPKSFFAFLFDLHANDLDFIRK